MVCGQPIGVNEMIQASKEQIFAAIGIFMNNAEWNAVSVQALQQFIDNPVEAGKLFTIFIGNAGKEIKNPPSVLFVDRSKPFNPGSQRRSIQENKDSLALTSVDVVAIQTLKYSQINNENHIYLDVGIAHAFMKHQDKIPEFWKTWCTNGWKGILFPGSTSWSNWEDCQTPDVCNMYCLSFDGHQWNLKEIWGEGLKGKFVAAVLSRQSK